VIYADRSGDSWQRVGGRAIHANACFVQAAGRGWARFREAEQMQADLEPKYPLLCSLLGFWYCDLLLTGAERERGRQTERGAGRTARRCRAVTERQRKRSSG